MVDLRTSELDHEPIINNCELTTTNQVFTEQQLKALDFRRHLSVTANAGAGKTTVLVQRFIEILVHTPARLSEIVAITFTEKAAGELRKKISGKIEEQIVQAASIGEKKRFEQFRDQLASAT